MEDSSWPCHTHKKPFLPQGSTFFCPLQKQSWEFLAGLGIPGKRGHEGKMTKITLLGMLHFGVCKDELSSHHQERLKPWDELGFYFYSQFFSPDFIFFLIFSSDFIFFLILFLYDFFPLNLFFYYFFPDFIFFTISPRFYFFPDFTFLTFFSPDFFFPISP